MPSLVPLCVLVVAAPPPLLQVQSLTKDELPLDRCSMGGSTTNDCQGKAAADAFCRHKGLLSALDFSLNDTALSTVTGAVNISSADSTLLAPAVEAARAGGKTFTGITCAATRDTAH